MRVIYNLTKIDHSLEYNKKIWDLDNKLKLESIKNWIFEFTEYNQGVINFLNMKILGLHWVVVGGDLLQHLFLIINIV